MRPVDATTVDHHDDFFPRVAKERHHLMDIVAKGHWFRVMQINMYS
jgi:hypothetical protein